MGGGCTLLRLASKVDAIKDGLDNDEEKVFECVVFKFMFNLLFPFVVFLVYSGNEI